MYSMGLYTWCVGRDIRISNQFLIARALHFAKPQAYYQASVTITLYCKMESTSNQKLVANSNIACGKRLLRSLKGSIRADYRHRAGVCGRVQTS